MLFTVQDAHKWKFSNNNDTVIDSYDCVLPAQVHTFKLRAFNDVLNLLFVLPAKIRVLSDCSYLLFMA